MTKEKIKNAIFIIAIIIVLGFLAKISVIYIYTSLIEDVREKEDYSEDTPRYREIPYGRPLYVSSVNQSVDMAGQKITTYIITDDQAGKDTMFTIKQKGWGRTYNPGEIIDLYK